MFEKERVKYQLEHTTPSLYKVVGTAWEDGAEFGYNKANEWHYIKDRDLPKEKGVYLTYRKNGLQLLAFDGAYWVTGVQDDMYNTIIAWKEIVLPELKENE